MGEPERPLEEETYQEFEARHLANRTAPLSDDEARELVDNEAIIERSFATFMEVGAALQNIRHKRLYRGTHRKWEDYLTERWNMTGRRALQYVEAYDTVEAIQRETGTVVPVSNERQARELAKIVKEDGPEAAAQAYQTAAEATGGKSTAKIIRQAAKAEETECLTPKLTFALDGARELGDLARKVGERLSRLGPDDLIDMSFEELQIYQDALYRARNALKKLMELS
jgi:hypothetical protein